MNVEKTIESLGLHLLDLDAQYRINTSGRTSSPIWRSAMFFTYPELLR